MIRIRVRGIPAPQGSKRAFRNKYSGRIQQVESSNRAAPWRSDIRDAAEKALADREPLDGPVDVTLAFRLPRPKGHYRTGKHAGELRPTAPPKPTGKPDLDKLTRAVLDALTGLVWGDDSQVVRLIVSKHYADDAPAGLDVWALDAIDRRLEESIP